MGEHHDWDRIGAIVEEMERQGLQYREGAKKFGIPEWMVYGYNKRRAKQRKLDKAKEERAQGEANGSTLAEAEVSVPSASAGKEPRSERTKESPRDDSAGADGPEEPMEVRGRKASRLPDELVEIIAEYKRGNPSHGFKRIEDWLKSKYLVVVPRKRIRSVLKEKGLLETEDGSFDRSPGQEKGTRRFEAFYPRQMWQMDMTHIYIEGISVLYLIVMEDDYSRFCVGAALERAHGGETMIGVLHNAQTRYGKPEKLLTDQGREFYSWSMEHTRFQKYLDDMRIEHIVSEPHSPQSTGKVERLIQTIKKELISKVRFSGYEEATQGIAEFIARYNCAS
jgi:transposase InsO family protein